MRFGPLELQACGENNFTMKALGALAFSRPLRQHFVRLLVGEGEVDEEDDVTLLFFSRIGEGFLREAIEREPHDGAGEFEARFNAAAGLPRDLRWKRKEDGRLVQPAKWQERHVEDMLAAHGSSHDGALRGSLRDLQDCLNTEPDLVLQWRARLVLVEIKVLSGEGRDQTGRQRRLGAFLSSLLGWHCDLRYVGPAHGRPPVDGGCRFVSWREVADWFHDVPEVAGYIREFRFFYRGTWQSMLSPHADAPGSNGLRPHDRALDARGQRSDGIRVEGRRTVPRARIASHVNSGGRLFP